MPLGSCGSSGQAAALGHCPPHASFLPAAAKSSFRLLDSPLAASHHHHHHSGIGRGSFRFVVHGGAAAVWSVDGVRSVSVVPRAPPIR